MTWNVNPFKMENQLPGMNTGMNTTWSPQRPWQKYSWGRSLITLRWKTDHNMLIGWMQNNFSHTNYSVLPIMYSICLTSTVVHKRCHFIKYIFCLSDPISHSVEYQMAAPFSLVVFTFVLYLNDHKQKYIKTPEWSRHTTLC